MTYNGWSNRATWNVSLWLNNDEGTYKELQSLTRRADSVNELAEQLEEFCKAIWLDGKTPDGDSLSEVDWEEIAQGKYDEVEHEKPEATPLDSFVDKYSVLFTAHRVAKRPDKMMEEPHITRHFRCRITNQKTQKSFGLYFSQGSAHTTPPTVADVLDCLASDATGYESAQSFEDWANEYGYDADSRKAEKIYRTVKRQAEQLKRVLGDEAYDELLWHTERL